MIKPKLHFAHANGFPGATYQALYEALAESYRVSYCRQLGHDARYPITDNWPELVSEVIADIKTQNTEKVLGVGHSLGGVLMLMAAIREPALFTSVIMLDAPVLMKLKRSLVKLAKQVYLIDLVTPAKKSRNRREHWRDKTEARAYCRDKALFKPFTDRCLEDYLQFGMVETDAGLTLAFDVAHETQIFRTLPHHISGLRAPLPVPVGLIYGDESDLISSKDAGKMEKHYALRVMPTPGGHMFPFSDPDTTAKHILRMAQTLKSQS